MAKKKRHTDQIQPLSRAAWLCIRYLPIPLKSFTTQQLSGRAKGEVPGLNKARWGDAFERRKKPGAPVTPSMCTHVTCPQNKEVPPEGADGTDVTLFGKEGDLNARSTQEIHYPFTMRSSSRLSRHAVFIHFLLLAKDVPLLLFLMLQKMCFCISVCSVETLACGMVLACLLCGQILTLVPTHPRPNQLQNHLLIHIIQMSGFLSTFLQQFLVFSQIQIYLSH